MRASFFDIDGTLIKGLMIHKFPEQLARRKIIDEKFFREIDNWVKLYLKNKTTYRRIAIEVPKIYSRCIEGVKEEKLKKEAKKFVDFYLKVYIQPYTGKLVKLMKTYGMTIGISGSPIEVVNLVGKKFNFDITYASELEVKDGVYTGKIKQNMIIKETKEKTLKKLVKENKIELEKSFGFGDTDQDLSFLSQVKMPVALNPNSILFNIARRNNWLVFTSKDDVAKSIKKLLK